MQQNIHSPCCTLYKNKPALSSSLFWDYFLSGWAVYFFRLPAGALSLSAQKCVSWRTVVHLCVFGSVCCVPRGRRLGICNAWLCSPVRHGRRIASTVQAARRMRRRKRSIGAPGGDPAPLGAAVRHRPGRQREGRQIKVPLSKAPNPRRLPADNTRLPLCPTSIPATNNIHRMTVHYIGCRGLE